MICQEPCKRHAGERRPSGPHMGLFDFLSLEQKALFESSSPSPRVGFFPFPLPPPLRVTDRDGSDHAETPAIT